MDLGSPAFADEPLAAFRLFGTRQVDVARDVIGRTFCPHRLEPSCHTLARFETRHNHVAGNFLTLNHLGYGGQVEIDPGLLDHFYLVQIPLEGTAQITNGRRSFGVGTGVGSILNPKLPTQMVWHAGCRKLLVQIRRGALEALVETYLGMALRVPVIFDPRLDLNAPGIRAWLLGLARCVQAAEHRRAFGASNYRFQQPIEEELTLGLVHAQPSSIAHFLDSPCARAAQSVQLRRARTFIHDNIAEPFRMEDLARAAGCGLRSLQAGFQVAFQVTPQHYIMRARLDLAHSKLQLDSQEETVANIAYDCGFAHLGRFAQAYRKVFGQTPSETLKSGKAGQLDASELRDHLGIGH